MPTLAPHTEKQQELDEDTRRVWREYYDELQNLAPEQYEQVELAAWETLQAQLGRIERRRRLLDAAAA